MNEICPICIEKIIKNEQGIYKTICNHIFHVGCLQQYNNQNYLIRLLLYTSYCPLCRSKLIISSRGPEDMYLYNN